MNTFANLARPFAVLIASAFAASAVLADHGGGSHINVNLSVPATDPDGNFTVTWNNTADQGLDEIQRLQQKLGSGSYVTIYSGYSGSRNITGRSNGTWTYRVNHEYCFGFFCTQEYSLPESVVVGSTPIPGVPGAISVNPSTTPIGAPEGGAAYTLSWPASSGTVLRYELNGTNIGVTTSKAYSGIAPGSYDYQVRACNNTGCSAYTAIKTVDVEANGIAAGPSLQSAGDIGSTPYAIDVATDGDALVSVPIQVVDGIRGFQPSLAFVYDSGRGVDRELRRLPEDTIGYGWYLAGMSQIRRCVVDQPNSQSINLTSSDELCLDGMPLVLISGTRFVSGAKYRTRVESFVELDVKVNAGHVYFEARMPDGTTHQYGFTEDSRVNYNGGTVYQWSLNKSIDAFDNEIIYDYFKPQLKGTNYPVSIEYADAKVAFKYESRTDATAELIGTAPQTRSVFLHTVEVSYDDKMVREYRLIDELVGGNKRVSDIQLCGYTIAGFQMSCLDSLHFDWTTPSSTMAGVEILLEDVTDSLGAETRFEYGTITGSSHPFFFSSMPSSWGTPSYATDTQALSGSGARRHVVTRLRRDNGLAASIFSDTEFAYNGVGINSTKNWGFLGFFAQRVTDVESGIVTYVQNRSDFPHFGQVSRLYQYDDTIESSGTILSAGDVDFAALPYTHSSSLSTSFPYALHSLARSFEGGVMLGASKSSNAYTFVSGLVSEVIATSVTGTSQSFGSLPSTWGDVAPITVTGVVNTNEVATTYQNRTTSGQWLIGFPTDIVDKSWPGVATGTPLIRDADLSPHASSLDVASMTQFPTHATLTLTTSFGRDSQGRQNSRTVSGDNVAPRTWDVTTFRLDRYAGVTENPLGHTTTHPVYDHRFGVPKDQGSPNNVNTTWTRDQFGRTEYITRDGAPGAEFTYNACTPMSCATSYGVQPVYVVKRFRDDSMVDNIIVPENVYLDRLGRPVRRETLSVSGLWSRVDTEYDREGRVKRQSMPYFSGASIYSTVFNYDIQGRIDTVTRPDNSNTNFNYSRSGSDLVEDVIETIRRSDGTLYGTQTKRNIYNVLGQLKKTTDAYGSSDAVSIDYLFDAHGNMTSAAVNAGGTTSLTTTFGYDEAGNRTSTVSPNAGTITNTFTALNQLRTTTDARGTTTQLYDLIGRIQSRTNGIDGTATWIWDTASSGYGKGKLRELEKSGFSEVYDYNSDGKLFSIATEITPIGGGAATTYTTTQTYDNYGRPSITTYPGTGLQITREYNTNGHFHRLKNGSTTLQTIVQTDAFGNSIDEVLGNLGSATYVDRVFDQKTGRLSQIDTIKQGGTQLRDQQYFWRSDGVFERRNMNVVSGLSGSRFETFGYDALNRLKKAETFINSSNTRDLDYDYDLLGNLETKTSTLTGDTDVTGQTYGAGSAGPNALTYAVVNGVGHTLTYDAVGAVTKYDISGTSDDKYILYNSINQPVNITWGTGLTDTTPVARDQFAYAPDGRRYYRKTSWYEGATARWENVAIAGAVEIITDNVPDGVDVAYKTRISRDIMHVQTESGSTTQSFFEFAHRDHLGSIEIVTDANGNVLDRMANEPFGMRKAKDWSSNIVPSELTALLSRSSTKLSRIRGFTSHEHLDRTGFIHMNGRVYDPATARFLSPDPIVPFVDMSQSWNSYSYTRNSVLSFIDPSGYTEEDVMDEVVSYGQQTAINSFGFGSWSSMIFGGNRSTTVSVGSIPASSFGAGASGDGQSNGQSGEESTETVPEIIVTASRDKRLAGKNPNQLIFAGPPMNSLDSKIRHSIATGNVRQLKSLLEATSGAQRQLVKEAIKRLETRAGDLIRQSHQRSKSFHRDLAERSYAELLKMRNGPDKKRVRQMIKLIKEQSRLSQLY